ncbi:MFS general substrate transporter [Neolentinus lepideus HHB14362 ss-1]|uniref:MFS general substrate transporter n=1 Tax=Neolentinus lepideus HHB14362 ss-1 TaxID=1314782 RepID=A0A165TBN7_9AGAM|nr:MFS general substrate transporter [Neolentinus lepideus HHB14362 ss-1]
MSPPSAVTGSSSTTTGSASPPDVSTQLSRIERLRAKCKPVIILIFAGSMILDIFSSTALVFAQSSIAEHFAVSQAVASWTLSAYSLTFGSFLLLVGRAGDIFGHKQIYTAGLAFFSLFSALSAGITSSLIALIVLRAFLGISAAATIPTAYALVATTFQGKALEMAVAGLGACQCIGLIIGVILSGVFTETSLGYRGLFWLSFGLGVILSLLAFLLIPPTPSRLKDMRSLDYGGAVIVTVGALLLVLGFTEAQAGWDRAVVIAPIVVGGIVFILFSLYEEVVLPRWMKDVEPLVPRRVWRYKNLVPILGTTCCYYGTFFILILNGSRFYIDVQHRSIIISAVQFTPVAIGAFILMPIAGNFYNHRFMPPKWVIALGQGLCVASVALFSQNQVDSSYWHWSFPSLVLYPIGSCFFFVNFLNIVYASAPQEEQGLISGIVQMAGQISTALAFGIGSSFVTGGTREQLLEQYRRSFYLAVALAGLAVVTAVVFVRSIPPKPKKNEDEEKGTAETQLEKSSAEETVK